MYSKRIEELRQHNNLTKREIAKVLNVAESTYGKWELGQRKPDIDTITALADFYEVSVDYLLGKTDDPAPRSKITPPRGEESYIYIFGSNGDNKRIFVPEEKREKLEKLLELALPELLGDDDNPDI